MRSLRLVTLVLVGTLLASAPAAFAQQKQPTATGSGGAAATVDLLGTRAAIDTLDDGGNAVDAAVAAAAVLGVTEPYSCGIGGGGFMVIRTPEGDVTTIDSREESPAAMRPDSFFDSATGAPLPFNDARYSGLSAGVPGTVAGWDRALREYGTQSLREILGAGIDTAREGFIVDQTFVDQTDAERPLLRRPPRHGRDLSRPGRHAARRGDRAQEPRPRSHLRADRHARDEGLLPRGRADAMVEAVQNPPIAAGANHSWRPGLMTMRDVRRYAAIEREPTHIGYRGLDVWGMGPPSSGGSTVGEALNILEGLPPTSTADRERPGPAPVPRVLALLVRGPRRLPRGSRLLRRSAARACSRTSTRPSAGRIDRSPHRGVRPPSCAPATRDPFSSRPRTS